MSDVDPSCRFSGVFIKDEKTGRIILSDEAFNLLVKKEELGNSVLVLGLDGHF